MGTIHVTYAKGDEVFYCASTDSGRTFSKAVKLPPAYDISLGMRRGPRIVATSKAICISVIGGRQGKGRDGDLLCFRSTDGGRTWSGPSIVNDEPDAAREGLHAMASGEQGLLCCVWLDLRSSGTEVMAAVSHDHGETWGANVLAYRSPSGSVCECCHPSVHIGPGGRINVLFRNSLDGVRDMYTVRSTDNGKSFGSATKLGKGTWPLKSCPMDGGAIAQTNEGENASVWRREKSIYLTVSPANTEIELGKGEQPWLSTTSAGVAAVWLTKRGGTLLYRKANEEAVK
jgi:hypothetical protein